MSTTKIFYGGPLIVSGTSGFQVDGIDSQSLDPKQNVQQETAAGAVYPTHVAVFEIQPLIPLTFSDLKTAFDNGIWLDGFAFPQSTDVTTVDLYGLKSAPGSARASGSVNLRHRLNAGAIIPRTLVVEQGKKAMLTVDVIIIYDGTNAAVITATNIAAPTAGGVDQIWTLGPAKFNGTAFDGLQKWTLNFNIAEEIILDSGGQYPTRVHVGTAKPTFDLEVKNGSAIADYLLGGTAQSSTDSIFYLQKMTNGGGPVAAATTEHISISVDDGILLPGPTGGQNGTSHSSKLTFYPNYDLTNAILVKDTATAIS